MIIYKLNENKIDFFISSLEEFWQNESLSKDMLKIQTELINLVHKGIKIYFVIGLTCAFTIAMQNTIKFINGKSMHFRSDALTQYYISALSLIGHLIAYPFIAPFLIGFSGLLYFFWIFLYSQLKILKIKIKRIDFSHIDNKVNENNEYIKMKYYAKEFSKILR